MRAKLEPIYTAGQSSFLIRAFEEPVFSAPYHYHPEFELTYIVEGCGNRFVGKHISRFQSGDLVLLGENLSHCWKSEPLPNGNTAKSFVLHFVEKNFGIEFWTLPEMAAITRLLQNCAAGIQFTKKTGQVYEQLQQINQAKDPFERLMRFLNTLQFLATQVEYVILDTNFQLQPNSPEEEKRLAAVWQYMTENYTGDIQLNEAAQAAHMTGSAFCKYFKRTTRKTFMEMVIDWRIEHARNLLTATDHTIADICFESGFRDLSNFHRTFRSKHYCTPLQYRKLYTNLSSPATI